MHCSLRPVAAGACAALAGLAAVVPPPPPTVLRQQRREPGRGGRPCTVRAAGPQADKATHGGSSAPGRGGNCLVYMGSSFGDRPEFRREVEEFGRLLAERGYVTVYGGGRRGLMGVFAEAALQAGGRVHGVITQDLLEREAGHMGLAVLDVVPTMGDRKERMLDLADMVVALPGGLGTFEEFMEALSQAQLGYHQKPLGLLNTDGYFDSFLAMLRTCAERGFMRQEFLSYVVVADSPSELLAMLEDYAPDRISKTCD